jgi:hypothetical protein
MILLYQYLNILYMFWLDSERRCKFLSLIDDRYIIILDFNLCNDDLV